jgi:alpha-L-fucosidase
MVVLHEYLQIMGMKSIFLGVALLLGGRAMAGTLEVAPAVETETPSVASEQETERARQERIKWWREARFGMMVCWGLYSIPAGSWKDIHGTGYSEWIMFTKIPIREYEQLAGQFNPAEFDAKAWVAIAKKAGMKYIVPMGKHHDGFSMYHSKLTKYNIVDATPFKRDVTRELADACREAGLRFGCYYSVDRDWYRPTGPGNRYKQSNTWDFPDSKQEDWDRYFQEFAKPQVEELLTSYKPDILWFDGIDMMSDPQVDALYRSIRKLAPDCLINSRIKGLASQIPPPNYDYISTGDNEIAEKLMGIEWENPGTMNSSYAYNKNVTTWVDSKEVVARLVDIVSKGGNYLLNVGPTAEGVIPQPSVDRLMDVGKWMETNHEAIYETMPWRVYGEGPLFEAAVAKAGKKGRERAPGGTANAGREPARVDIRFTAKGNSVYAICLAWPEKNVLVKALSKNGISGKAIKGVRMLGSKDKIKWKQTDDGLTLSIPREKPCSYAFVYRIDFK